MDGQVTQEYLEAQRKERIGRTEAWLGAKAISHHGVPIKQADDAPDYVERMADEELKRIRQLLGSGLSRVCLDIADPRAIERITSQLTDAEKGRVSFGA